MTVTENKSTLMKDADRTEEISSRQPKPLDVGTISLKGTKLIEASAGTGKTYAITGLYVRLVVESQLSVDRILVVTFTEAATRELRERIRARLIEALTAYHENGSDDPYLDALVRRHKKAGIDLSQCRRRLSLALHSIDLAAIYTIHGFCMRVLQDCAFESGVLFDFDFHEDDSELLGQIIDDYWRKNAGCWHDVLTSYLYRKNINADSLFVLLQQPVCICRAAGADILRLPSHSKPVDFSPELSRLKNIWLQEKDTIASLLQSPALSKAKSAYSPGNVSKWLAALGEYFSGAGVPLPFEAFEKLSDTHLRRDTKPKKVGETPEHIFFQLSDDLVGGCDKAYYGIISECIQFCLEELPVRKNATALLSFDDLLTGVRDSLRHPDSGKGLAAKVRKQYKAVLIDEFQDTDAVQYEIFSRIYLNQSNPLFLIGDPKQAIYRFRGADIYAYLQAVKAVGRDVYGLDTNWRSQATMITAFNLLFANHKTNSPFLIPEIQYQPVKAPSRRDRVLYVSGKQAVPMSFSLFPDLCKRAEAKQLVADDMAEEISDLLRLAASDRAGYACVSGDVENSTPLQAGDIAVLVRNHMDGELVRKSLSCQGVRAVMYSRQDVFLTEEARELEILLAAVLNPANERLMRAALTTRVIGWDAEKFLRSEEDETVWDEVLERFHAYQKQWSLKGFSVMAATLFRNEEVAVRIAGFTDGERRLTNFRHLIEILQDKAHKELHGPAALFELLQKYRHDSVGGEERQLKLDSDESLVKIVTIHKSKGLEYPVVYCPFLWDSSFLRNVKSSWVSWHDADGREWLDFGTAQFDSRLVEQEKETLAEELRLLYVAVTRARNRCRIYWGRAVSGRKSVTASSGLNYLLHPPEEPWSGSPVKALEKRFKSLIEDEVFAPLYRMAESAPDAVNVTVLDRLAALKKIRQERPVELAPVPEFNRELAATWAIKSFSGLQRHDSYANEEPDHDAFFAGPDSATSLANMAVKEDSSSDVLSVFDFPKGARAGNCLHTIFEKLDFLSFDRKALIELVDTSLHEFGISDSWNTLVADWVENVLATPLGSNAAELCLNKIPMQQRLVELEFYYSLPMLADGDLNTIFRHRISPSTLDSEKVITYGDPTMLFSKPEKFTCQKGSKGFMKGFIDLVFEWQGKYYILDYKSNHLGDRLESYSNDRLQDEMVRSGYDLQYYIYLVALHRYLRDRLPGYRYDTHMGGVYYLFLRGMSPDHGSRFGVYYDLPCRQVIEEIDQLLVDTCNDQ